MTKWLIVFVILRKKLKESNNDYVRQGLIAYKSVHQFYHYPDTSSATCFTLHIKPQNKTGIFCNQNRQITQDKIIDNLNPALRKNPSGRKH